MESILETKLSTILEFFAGLRGTLFVTFQKGTWADLTRIMSRVKALYRSWAIPCAGRDVYYTRHRNQWLGKIREAGVRRRAEQLYQQLDMLQHSRKPGENCWRRVADPS